MKTRKKRHYTWYMEPFDPQTNRVIAALVPPEDAIHAVAIGKTVRSVWRCCHADVKKCLAATPTLGLKFAIFKKEGIHGPIRPWKFEKAKAS